MDLPSDFSDSVSFDVEVLEVHQWKFHGDAATLQISTIGELIVLHVVFGDGGKPLCDAVEFGQLTADEENYFFWKELRFQSPVRFAVAENLSLEWEMAVGEKLVEFQDLLDSKVQRIRALNWHPQRGRKMPDLYCARLADLFVYLQSHGSNSAIEDCAHHLDLAYDTVKTRLGTARERQMLSTPGKGQKQQSSLLPAGIRLLEDKEVQS